MHFDLGCKGRATQIMICEVLKLGVGGDSYQKVCQSYSFDLWGWNRMAYF